jgi:hypothetical protein
MFFINIKRLFVKSVVGNRKVTFLGVLENPQVPTPEMNIFIAATLSDHEQ